MTTAYERGCIVRNHWAQRQGYDLFRFGLGREKPGGRMLYGGLVRRLFFGPNDERKAARDRRRRP